MRRIFTIALVLLLAVACPARACPLVSSPRALARRSLSLTDGARSKTNRASARPRPRRTVVASDAPPFKSEDLPLVAPISVG